MSDRYEDSAREFMKHMGWHFKTDKENETFIHRDVLVPLLWRDCLEWTWQREMPKGEPITLNLLNESDREALRRYPDSPAKCVREIVVEWLKDNGYDGCICDTCISDVLHDRGDLRLTCSQRLRI